MLAFDEARSRLLSLVSPAERTHESLELHLADGRVLAEDVAPPFDLPAFDASTMDGYAVARESLAETGGALLLAGESRAGHAPRALAKDTTMRIFTGAMLPEGADAVVMQEHVEARDEDDGKRIVFPKRPPALANVRRRGSDLARGEAAISKGTRLGPADLALAASCDRGAIVVATRPRVSLITNGDELRAPGAVGPAGSLPESNAIAIATMARRAGAQVVVGKTLPDVRATVARALDEAMSTADLVVTIGGVSVGDHDVVRGALEDAGISLDFFRVAIKPGKPLVVGTRKGAILLGLPGNPASAMVTFALFGVPLLRTMAGDRSPLPRTVPARLAHAVAHEPGRMELVRATLANEEGTLVARAVRHQASGAGIGIAKANALVVIPRDASSLEAGALVEAYPFEELCL